MTRTAYVLKELARNFKRYPGTALASFLSLTLLLLLFDLYWIGAGTSERFYTTLLSDMNMELFVDEMVPDSVLPSLQARLEATEGVRGVDFVSKEEARAELSRLVGTDLLVGYDSTNPLPRSFLLTFAPDYLNSADMANLAARMEKQPEITRVCYSERWLRKAEATRATILNFGMVLGALILLAALISSLNSIRLMTRARAVGFQQMRLLGAGKLFLALPFLLEGMIIAGLSAVAGWLLIYYAYHKITFTQFELVIPTLEEIAIFCGVTALLGIISGYLGIRKLLR